MLAVKKIAPVQVREASLEDYAQVAELESRYGLQKKTFESGSICG